MGKRSKQKPADLIGGLFRQPATCPLCSARPVAVDEGLRSYMNPMHLMLAEMAHFKATGREEHPWMCLGCNSIGWPDGLHVTVDGLIGASWAKATPPTDGASFTGDDVAQAFARLLATRPAWTVRRA